MVYCNHISHNKKTAKYSYGGSVDNITGVVEFSIDGSGFTIVKEPEKNASYLPAALNRLYATALERFSGGNYPDKLSYEL